MKYLITFLLVFQMTSFGVTRTATVSGDWDNTATWGGNPVPVSGDIADINGDVVVTIPVGVNAVANTVDTAKTANSTGIATLIINGTLTTEAGGSLKSGSGANRDGKLVFGPGGILTNGAPLYINNGYWQSTATKANPFIVRGAGSITTLGVSQPSHSVMLSNVVFNNTGLFNLVLETNGVVASRCEIAFCTFTGVNGVTIGSTDTLSNTVFSITNSDFRSFAAIKTIVIRRVNGGGSSIYEFRHNTLAEPISGANILNLTPTTSTNLLIEGNVFYNAEVTEASPGGNIITNNFNASTTAFKMSNAAGCIITYNYLIGIADNRNGFTMTGTAGSGTHHITYNVLEGDVNATWTGRPDFFIPNATPLPIDYSGNLVIGAGEHIAGLSNPNYSTGLNVKNNTLAVTLPSGTDSGGSIYVAESATKSTGVLNIANNLQRGNSNAGGKSFIGTTSGAAQVFDYSDYNNIFHENTPYDGAQLTVTAGNTAKTVPGSHDIGNDPMFYDETRNLAKWNLLYGSGVNATTNGIVYMLGINGYQGTPNFDQNGTISTNGPWHLISWVRQGFLATNPTLRAAGDPSDGSPDIGIGYTGLKGAIGTFFGTN